MSLSGRLAIVTGGGSGIGKSVCHALAKEGATILVADINLDAAVEVAKTLPGEDILCYEYHELVKEKNKYNIHCTKTPYPWRRR